MIDVLIIYFMVLIPLATITGVVLRAVYVRRNLTIYRCVGIVEYVSGDEDSKEYGPFRTRHAAEVFAEKYNYKYKGFLAVDSVRIPKATANKIKMEQTYEKTN